MMPGVPNPLAGMESQLLTLEGPRVGTFEAAFINAEVKDTDWGKRFEFTLLIEEARSAQEVKFSLPIPKLTFKINGMLAALGLPPLAELSRLPTLEAFNAALSKGRHRRCLYTCAMETNKEGKSFATHDIKPIDVPF